VKIKAAVVGDGQGSKPREVDRLGKLDPKEMVNNKVKLSADMEF
jgi:hypothetical protein